MYFVFELQQMANGQCAVLPYHDDSWTYQQAESVFYAKCSAAAISQIPIHTVMLADVEGAVYAVKTWSREV